MNDVSLTKSDPTTSNFICHYVNLISSKGFYYGENSMAFSLPSLLLQLSVITILTGIVHFLLKPFGQPLIISQILVGVILGPSALGYNSSLTMKLFPVSSRLVLDTMSVFGFMFFMFLIGVKADASMVFRSGKKPLFIGILGFFIPYGMNSLFASILERFSSLDQSTSKVLPQLALMLSMTSFPVMTCFLDELKILNSEIGRLASSSSFISDICHWSIMSMRVISELAKTKSVTDTMWSVVSCTALFTFMVFGIRPAALWAVRHTPEGKPVKEVYIFSVLVALMCCGLVGEVIGLSAIVASLAMGLVIPEGPPLGAALVEKLDCLVYVLLMPLFFAVCGLELDIFAIHNFNNVGLLQLFVLIGFIVKLVATILPPLFCRMPFRDALSFALIMNTKGIVEFAILFRYSKTKMISQECYGIMMISVVVITGVISPLIKVIYDPSKRFLAYKRRTILHLRRHEELRILACVHSQDNVRSLVGLVHLSNPKKDSHINLVVLHLIKLMGRASSLLIADHRREKPSHYPSQSERIFNAFQKLESQNNELLTVHCYKGISPYASMYNDVCALALEQRTILVIAPYHKMWIFGQGVESSNSLRQLNKNVLEKAPCSVGILIDRGTQKRSRLVLTETTLQKIAVLFFGGPDDREALAYAQRMSDRPHVELTLIRFTPVNASEIVGGKDRSKVLDADILNDFRRNNLRREGAIYQEEVVANGAEVVAGARATLNAYDLIMVGRRHAESQIMNQLHKWNESGELGAIGEILASKDVKSGGLVLVLQQQTKLWGLQDPEESTHLRKLSM